MALNAPAVMLAWRTASSLFDSAIEFAPTEVFVSYGNYSLGGGYHRTAPAVRSFVVTGKLD